ncbi:restriction endonuclease [Deinococcota bacterium DY0809b]
MTYLDAAKIVLEQAKEPLHYQEITKRALSQNLIQPQGATPEATMGSRLYTDTLKENSLFVRVGRGLFDLRENRQADIDTFVRKINDATRSQLHRLLHEMPPDRFEALIGELLVQMGFDENTVEVTQRSNDGGIDVVGVFRAAGLTEMNVAVQVKRWKQNVGAPVVTQLRGSLQVHQQGIVITTSNFTNGARQEALSPNKARIGLIDGEELVDLLIKHQVGVASKDLKVIGLDEEWWGEMLLDEVPDPATPQISRRTASPKPTSVWIFNQEYPVNTWKDVLLKTAEVIYELHPYNFENKASALRGTERQYIARSKNNMISPKKIPGSELWIETNFSREDILRMSRRLLSLFGYTGDKLIVSTE